MRCGGMKVSNSEVEKAFSVAAMSSLRGSTTALEHLGCAHDPNLDDESYEENSPKWTCGGDFWTRNLSAGGHLSYDVAVDANRCWTGRQGGGSFGDRAAMPRELAGCLPKDGTGELLSIKAAKTSEAPKARPTASQLEADYEALSRSNGEMEKRLRASLARSLQPATFEDFSATAPEVRRLIRAKVGKTAEDHRGHERPTVRSVRCSRRRTCRLAWQEGPVGLVASKLGLKAEKVMLEDLKEVFGVLFTDHHLRAATITIWGPVTDIGGRSSDAPALRVSCTRAASRRIDWRNVKREGLMALCHYRPLVDLE
jgi:hypothetical protein